MCITNISIIISIVSFLIFQKSSTILKKKLNYYNFIHLVHTLPFIDFQWGQDSGPSWVYPWNTYCEAGIHHGWEVSPSPDPTYTY